MSKRLNLKKDTVLLICRNQRGELNPNLLNNWSSFTVAEAVNGGRFDNDRGTMEVRAKLENPDEFEKNNGVQLDGNCVYFRDGVVFVRVLEGWEITSKEREEARRKAVQAREDEISRAFGEM